MKSIPVFIIICIVVTTASVIRQEFSASYIYNGVYDYHRRTGIGLAEKIRKYEDEIAANKQRITGGSPTEIGAVPYQAGLVITILYVFQSVCGGSLISETRVLTAAHCYSDGVISGQSMTVVLGSTLLFSGGTRIETTDIVTHSAYNPSTAENDIAIIRVPSVTFSSLIQPASLPSGDEVNMDFNGFQARASGYGMTSDEDSISLFQTVSSVTVPVISNAQCMSIYGSFILAQHLCTSGDGGRGTCGGDSGGPLVVDMTSGTILIGITSFGADACEAAFPSAYVRVTEFIQWISSQLN
ncbi:brachyurin-like [Choristoneura fumiferana]|uniref:brachyurin-like n=1 Tax=Choristoneura fumiferana TaxID=7141 RepID=UPI003D155949